MPDRTRRLLSLVASLLVLMTPTVAVAQSKGPPPMTLTDDQVEQLVEAYEALGEPSCIVVYGQQIGGRWVWNDPEPFLGAAIARSLESEMMRAGVDILAPDIMEVLDQRTQDAIASNASGVLPGDAIQLLGREFGADLVFEIRLPLAAGRYAPAARVLDTEAGRPHCVTNTGWRIPPQPPPVFIGGTAVKIIQDFIKASSVTSTRKKRLELNFVGDFDEDDVDLLIDILDEADVQFDEDDFDYEQASNGSARANVQIRHTERSNRRVFRRITRAAEDLGDLTLCEMERNLSLTASLYVHKGGIPTWWEITDPATDGFEDALRGRVALLERLGRPRLVIKTLDDFGEAKRLLGQADWRDDEGPATFNRASLQTAIERFAFDMGFEVVDAATMERQLDQRTWADLAAKGAVESAIDNEVATPFELALIVGSASNARGELAVTAKLVDLATGSRQSVSFPEPKAFVPCDWKVDRASGESVARYLVGHLVEQFDRQAARYTTRTLKLRVVNMQRDEGKARAAELIRRCESIPGVARLRRGTGGPASSSAILDYDLNLTDVDRLHAAIEEIAASAEFDAVVSRTDGEILVSFERSRRKFMDFAIANPAMGSVMGLAQLRAANLGGLFLAPAVESVFLVGVRRDNGTFIPVGSAFTVASNRLGTTAAVAKRLVQLASGGGTIVAKSASDLDRELEIGSAWVHGGYDRYWDRRYRIGREGFHLAQYDVGLLEVTSGDEGDALMLAPSGFLRPNLRVGYVGVPIASIGDWTYDPTAYAVRWHVGRVAGLTGYDLLAAAAGTHLVHTNLRTGHGTAGSPIVAEDGTVVAIHATGPTANLVVAAGGQVIAVDRHVSYGQNVTVLQELIAAQANGDAIAVRIR